jgi:hypothetical protein
MHTATSSPTTCSTRILYAPAAELVAALDAAQRAGVLLGAWVVGEEVAVLVRC